jgi:hypothetical protein
VASGVARGDAARRVADASRDGHRGADTRPAMNWGNGVRRRLRRAADQRPSLHWDHRTTDRPRRR